MTVTDCAQVRANVADRARILAADIRAGTVPQHIRVGRVLGLVRALANTGHPAARAVIRQAGDRPFAVGSLSQEAGMAIVDMDAVGVLIDHVWPDQGCRS